MKASHLLNEIGDDKCVWFIEGDTESGKTTLLKKCIVIFMRKNGFQYF